MNNARSENFISPYDGDYFHNYNNIVSDLTFLCFNGVCNEETMVFPKRRNITPIWMVVCTRFSLRSLCSPRSSSFWLSSLSCRFFINANCSLVSARSWAYDHKLIMNLISVLCQVVPKWRIPQNELCIHNSEVFLAAQRHCGSTAYCSSARSVTSVLFVKVSLCHFVCRSFCNWHSIAFWIQVSASLLLPAQSSVKDIKDPSGNYSLPGFKECKQITSHNYMGCVGLTKHITQKIRHVFCDIHHLRWITEVIQGVCTKYFKLATVHNGWIVKMLKIHLIQIWICTAWLSVYVHRTHLEAFAFRIL